MRNESMPSKEEPRIGCLTIIVHFWLTLIAAVGGYKAFMWVLNL